MAGPQIRDEEQPTEDYWLLSGCTKPLQPLEWECLGQLFSWVGPDVPLDRLNVRLVSVAVQGDTSGGRGRADRRATVGSETRIRPGEDTRTAPRR